MSAKPCMRWFTRFDDIQRGLSRRKLRPRVVDVDEDYLNELFVLPTGNVELGPLREGFRFYLVYPPRWYLPLRKCSRYAVC